MDKNQKNSDSQQKTKTLPNSEKESSKNNETSNKSMDKKGDVKSEKSMQGGSGKPAADNKMNKGR